MKIDYIILIYDDDIEQDFKGDVMKDCLYNTHNQTLPVNITIVVAKCTPKSTLDYIELCYPDSEVDIRPFNDLYETIDYYYERSHAEIVIFSKIISIPNIKRAQSCQKAHCKFPQSAGSLSGMQFRTESDSFIRLYSLSERHGFNQGSPSAWAFHKKILPKLNIAKHAENHSQPDASFLLYIIQNYQLIAFQYPLITYYWDERVRAKTHDSNEFDQYVEYWKSIQNKVKPLIKLGVN